MIESVAEWAWVEIARATVLLATVAGGAFVLRRASAAARHLVWCAGLVALLALPLLAATVPWRWSPIPARPAGVTGTNVADPVLREAAGRTFDAAPAAVEGTAVETGLRDAVVTSRDSVPFAERAVAFLKARALPILGAVWVLGVLVTLARMALGAVVLRLAVRRGRELDDATWRTPLYEAADRIGLSRVPRLVQSGRMPMPFVTGIVQPVIVLPSSASMWTAERRRAVLLHELAHVRRGDVALDTVARVASALWWFHPLARVAARQLRAESERACDDLVLRVGTRPSTYADHLLQIVRDAGRAAIPASALPMAQRHEFEGRMLAILEADARRDPPRVRHTIVALAAFALLLLPLAGLGPAAASADQPSMPEQEQVQPPEPPAVDAQPTAEGREEEGDQQAAEDARVPAQTETIDLDMRIDVSSFDFSSLTAQDTGVIGALREALRDPSAEVRREAVWGLGSLGATSVVPDLVALLGRETDEETRELTVWSLAHLGDDSAIDAIAQAARSDEGADVREMATWALGQFRSASTLPAVLDALADEDEEVRGIAAWAIGTMRPETAPPALIDALDDESGEVREHAAWAVGQIGDPAAISGLTDLIADDEAGEAALWAIGRIGGEAARPALMEALRNGNPEVRAAAARALAGRSGSHPWPWPWPRPMTRH